MNEAKPDPRAIFCAALDLPSAVEQDKYVAEACGDDADLRQRVQALLRADREAGSFLAEPEEKPIAPTVEVAAAIRENAGEKIGPYKLLQQIGEGGFGVVYMAEQQRPVRRKVALKVIKPGMDTKEVIARFEAERQALALMDHPNIAKVLDAGTTESGRPYFVMELVKGIPLIEFCDSNNLTTHRRLELFVTVCRAIQHAHHKGVIHRDLKPSNVMVTLHDGKPVPKVIDFGVSKAISQQLTEKTLFTAYGQMIGTPVYMSPEQAEMSGLDIDTRSDIYSLGVLLYELLTGTTPLDVNRLRSSGYAEMQRLIREEEPPKPSTRLSTQSESSAKIAAQRGTEPKKLGQIVRGELDWIVMKALEKDRERRYDSANGFAADVERFLKDEPVVACPPSVAYRLRKFSRRHKAVLATTTLVAAALVAGTAVSMWQAYRANQQAARADKEKMLAAAGFEREKKAHADAERARADAQTKRQQAESAQELAEALRQETRRQLYASDMMLASQAYADGSIEHMQELLVKHWPSESDVEDLRGFEWDYLAAAGNLYLNVYPNTDYWPYGRIVISPDGRWFVNTVWPRSLNVLERHPPGPEMTGRGQVVISSYLADLAFSANGEFLADGGLDGKIRIWDCSTWKKIPSELDGESHSDSAGVMSVAFAPQPNQNILASGGKGSPIIFWDTATWMPLASIPVGGTVQDLAFSRDGKSLAAALSNGQLVLCDVAAREVAETVTSHRQPITCIASSPRESLFATGSDDGTIRLWNDKLQAGTTLSAGAPVTTLTFSWDGTRLAAGTAENNRVLVWNMDSRSEPTGHRPIHTLRAHSRRVNGLAFHWAGPTVMWSVSDDGTNKLWALNRSESHATIRNVLPSTNLAYSADGRTLFYQDQQRVLRGWNLEDRRQEERPVGGGVAFLHLAFSDDGAAMAGTHNGHLQVRDLTRNGGELIYQHQVTLQPDSRVAVTLQGQRVAWTIRQDADFDILIHDLGSGKETHIPPSEFVKRDDYLVHEWPVFSPAGTRLLGQRHMATFVWDVTNDPPELWYQFNGWGVEHCGAFSPDGQTVAVGSTTHDIRLHDAKTGDLLHVLQGHTSPVLAVAFLRGPTGQRLVSGDDNGVVRIWDVEEGRPLGTLGKHYDGVTSIACSPVGDSVASSSRDGTVKVWLAGRIRAEKNLMTVRGDTFIRQERWLDAAAAYQQVLNGLRPQKRVGPDAPLYWLTVATLLAKGGDQEGYRQHCRDFLTKTNWDDLSPHYHSAILWACSLYPDLIGGDQLPTRKVIHALEDARQRGDFQRVGTSDALAALHRGDFQQALDVVPQDYDRYDPLYPLIAAVAQCRLGRLEEARESLNEAGPIIDLWLSKSRLTNRRHLQSWEKWLRADFLHRQTEALLEAKRLSDQGKQKASR